MKRTYNLEPEEQDALSQFQGGKCAIDLRSTGASRNLSTDHSHACCDGNVSCGRCVRGFLCRPCNDMLGHSRDNVEFFQRAIAYILYPPLKRMRDGNERDSRLDDPGRIGRRFRPRGK
ncbi:endonuclease VII domain-containing protein [Nocardia nova]|uniref:endonuclease VII domain-containing protein n=1 Tax=Nocardia nova TaxID=37330 RepID=UPI0034E87D05